MTDNKIIRTLLIEDNPADAKTIELMLSAGDGTRFRLQHVSTLKAALERIEQGQLDVILLDPFLPDSYGLDTFLAVQGQSRGLPIIVLSSLGDESVALETVRQGAQDCLVKEQVQGPLLVRSIIYAIERKLAEERIKQLNEERERRIIELATANRELDAMTKKLAHARDQALEASNFKSEFVAKISHEIRTPISAVIGMIDLLEDTQLNIEQREFASIIQESAQSLLMIINDILDLSKMEAGKTELELIDFSPIALVEGSAELLASMAKENKLTLTTFIDPDLPPLLKGDPVRLRQILLNLLSNAIKFTEHGVVLARAVKESETENHVTLRFDVSDTGIGLSRQARHRLFQPFVQADGSTNRKYGGTGLGLSICKRLVEIMGGQIGIDSEEGEGSTFWFRLKLKISDTVKTNRTSFLAAAAANLRDIRVLVVDSDVISRDIINRYLKAAKISNDWVASGKEGLDLIARKASLAEPYDVAIVDLSSTTDESFEFACRLHRMQGTTRLVLLAAFDEKGRSDEAFKAGFSAYLFQPVRQSQLIDCLARVTGRLGQDVPLPVQRSSRVSPALSLKTDVVVLLAEDNPALRELALRQLKKLGLTADAVSTGKEAVEAVGRNPYALVLMDCQMPDMDGFEATRAMRKAESKSGNHIPIIAMTASAMHTDRDNCIAAGMDDYLSKPVSIEKLHSILERWMPSNQEPIMGHNIESSATSGDALNGPIDFEKLAELYGDSEVREILELFLPEARNLVASVTESIKTQDHRTLQSSAHQLKGLSASVAAPELAEISLLLEKAAREHDWTAALAKFPQLQDCFAKIDQFVSSVLSNPA